MNEAVQKYNSPELEVSITVYKMDLSHNLGKLQKTLDTMKEQIRDNLSGDIKEFQDQLHSYNYSIWEKIKPYNVLRTWELFIKAIDFLISSKINNLDIDDMQKQIFRIVKYSDIEDPKDFIKWVFDPCNTYWNVFYDYELKNDYRINECFSWETKKVYTIFRDEIQKLINYRKSKWVEIFFKKASYDNVDCGRIHIRRRIVNK